ncbi:MAPEG family protein [Aliiglaciecola sp. LCG003]|uniref:MAPEG family protein n=1 Tax=Aliiglaciecola sp. LCG003 TaxID=3053655 RepID=UPI0025735C8C|nr:MAPEG family protein [Aliiglaciecola sp. LCG003]WJG09838.1 MAPEG family protein [Aliiglaciecola sp. LCG003]
MNATIIALIGYISWTLLLLIAIGVYRTKLVLSKEHLANEFSPDGASSPIFGRRLTRAQTNCAESFVFTGGVLLLALATSSTIITDGLAYFLLAARLSQSITHLISTSVLAVLLRFIFFLIQVAISAYWLFMLFTKFTG